MSIGTPGNPGTAGGANQPAEGSGRPLAIASLQRNRARYLIEWLAFHLLVGVDRFYLYLHNCEDGSAELVRRLAEHYPITPHLLAMDTPPQLPAYQHAWERYGQQVSWLAFLDGDEFLYPVREATLAQALAPYAAQRISAVAAYWMCYGSSGHEQEPEGLLVERFTRHAEPGFDANHHIKSIVRGGELGVRVGNAHWFHTPRGTIDELGRPIHKGYRPTEAPSWEHLRINHYVTQSRGYFKQTKQRSGAADVNLNAVRPDSWFEAHDRNECDDGMRWRFLPALRDKVDEMRRCIGLPPLPPPMAPDAGWAARDAAPPRLTVPAADVAG